MLGTEPGIFGMPHVFHYLAIALSCDLRKYAIETNFASMAKMQIQKHVFLAHVLVVVRVSSNVS